MLRICAQHSRAAQAYGREAAIAAPQKGVAWVTKKIKSKPERIFLHSWNLGRISARDARGGICIDFAKVAKLVDAQDSGSCSHYGCMGSTPFFRIRNPGFGAGFFFIRCHVVGEWACFRS